ncbi:MAG: prepilin-type N-terminal cleavage/methylation domain-containing protein [Planctomycetota bacterium]
MKTTRPVFRRARNSATKRAGFTLLEVLITASVLLVGLLAMTSTSVVVNSLRRNASDQQRAQAAMQAIVEDLHATAREADDDPANWAGEVLAVYGPAGNPGNQIPVAGLDPWVGAPSVATVTIVTDETTTDAALGVALGMPRDLDGDGAATSPNVTGSASLLPAIVQLQWTGSTGQHQLNQVVYLLRY